MTAPLLTDAALGQMRAIQVANMVSECDLIAIVRTRGPAATSTPTPIVIATVPCRLSLANATLPLVAEQFTPEATFVLYLPALTDTTNIERAVVRGETDGVAWSVELVIAGTDEPRTFSASRRLRATLATDTVIPASDVGTVIVEPA